MRISKTFAVNVPMERIDMYRWVTEMTTEDYESFAPAHLAMGSVMRGSRFFMVNVECIGSDLLVQHYELIDYSKSHVVFYSRETKGFVFRFFPVTFSVPWEMRLRALTENACELHCTIGADFRSSLLGAVAWVNGLGNLFLRRHLAVEGRGFARSIERRFAS